MQKNRLRCKVIITDALSEEKRTIIIGKRKITAVMQERAGSFCHEPDRKPWLHIRMNPFPSPMMKG